MSDSPRPVTPSPEPLGLDPLDALRSIAQHSGDPGSRWVAQKSLDRAALPSAPDHRLRDQPAIDAANDVRASHAPNEYDSCVACNKTWPCDAELLAEMVLTRAVLSEATPSSEPVLDVDVVAIGEAATSALDELDNIRWDDIWEALAIAERPDLAEWTRSYVGYVRADIEKVIAELTLSASQTPEPDIQ